MYRNNLVKKEARPQDGDLVVIDLKTVILPVTLFLNFWFLLIIKMKDSNKEFVTKPKRPTQKQEGKQSSDLYVPIP